MSKYASKIGKVGKKALVSVQSDMRKNRIDNLISKDNLTKKEQRLVNATSVLGNVPSSGGKLGKFGLKNKRISGQLGSFNSSNTPTNINQALNTNSSVSIKSFITDPQSKTGILSQKDVTKGVDNFMSTLRDAAGVKDLNVNKSGNRISNIDVFADYRKTELSFNPKNLSFSTKGWELDIPDTFVKVDDTKFVAPETEFTSSMSARKKSGSSTKKSYNYGKYNPVEIILQDGGNKIKEILKKDTYMKTYDYDKDSDGDRDYSKNYGTFISEKQDFYDTGLLKSVNKWNDYTTYEYEKERDRSDGTSVDREEQKAIYKTREELFSDKGYKQSDKSWADYESEYEKEKSPTRYEEEIRNKTYLHSQTEYDDYGQKLREQQYDDYITRQEKEYDYRDEVRKDRDTYLKYDRYYTGGKLNAVLKYDDYVSDYDSGSKKTYVGMDSSGIIKQLASQSYYKRNPEKLENYIAYEPSKADEEEIEYKTYLESVTYYDPITGKVINREDFS